VTAPSRATIAGQAYLDLRRKARQDRRPVDELIQLYVLEGFLARLAQTPFAERFVLKGGMLLAALGERRPTRDIDLQASTTGSDTGTMLAAVRQIADTPLPDGVVFDLETAAAREIRDEDIYPGVRVTMTARLATARAHFHVDVSAGDPITPPARQVRIPRLLGGEITARGYPLAMVYSEKIVTAVARGTVNTRWRDFADIYLLTRRHPVDGTDLCRSVHEVARHRHLELRPLAEVLPEYGDIGQQRWAAWRAKQQLSDRLPEQFHDVVTSATDFADPAITRTADGHSWDPGTGTWS
jgi:Nucleotidyl transferase AbiEii toxin, Type IV TA system